MSPVDGGDGWTLHARAADFQAVDAVPVRALDGDWARYTPRGGRNVALRAARVELGASRRGWALAAVARADVVIDGSRGAWDTVHAYRQRLPAVAGTVYEVDATERGLVWAGLRGARSWTLREAASEASTGSGRLQLTAAATLLSLQRVQNVDARGRLQAGSGGNAGSWAFDAQALRQDSRRAFGPAGEYGDAGTRGRGFTADLGLHWQPTADSFVNLSVADLAARLRIERVASEELVASSATTSTDADGYLAYQPLVSGRYSARDLRPRPGRQWGAVGGMRVDTPVGGALVGLRWERTRGLDLPAAWAALPLAGGLTLQLDGEARFRSLGIGLAGRHGGVMLRSRSWPLATSHAFGWHAAFTLPL